MPRKPKPYLERGYWISRAGGSTVRLCAEVDGFDQAVEILTLLLSQRPTAPRVAPPIVSLSRLTVFDLLDLWDAHARDYYRLPNGRESTEVGNFRLSTRELRELFGDRPAASIDRRALQQVRDAMVSAGLSRRVINQRIGRIVRVFLWGAEQDHVPDTVPISLKLLRPLQAYRTPAPELPDITAVDESTVIATLSHLAEPWRSMVRVQWATGLRPEELCRLDVRRFSNAGRHSLWYDFGDTHKMAYRGRKRRLLFGPAATTPLAPWLFRSVVLYRPWVFSIGENPVLRTSYSHAIQRACKLAKVDPWFPNQIRHAYATRVRKLCGLDAAQLALDHARASTTEIYAELSKDQWRLIVDKLG